MPLSVLSPLAAPGCELLVTPAALQLGVAANGQIEDAISLTNPSVFVGQQLYQQVVALGFDVGGNIVEWSSSNALELTIGDF